MTHQYFLVCKWCLGNTLHSQAQEVFGILYGDLQLIVAKSKH
jgi:hypothetical protein